MSELVVISKKQLNEADYFRSYDMTTIGGKLLVKPDDFKTSYEWNRRAHGCSLFIKRSSGS